jgi:hypothetical protein
MSQGLPKQSVVIPLGQGLETDVDPKLLPAGKVTQLENAMWTAASAQGTAVKRPGYVVMPNNYVTSGSPGTLPVPWQWATHKGSTLALGVAGPRPVSSYSPAMGKWLTTPVTSADGIDGLSSKLRGQVIATRSPVQRSDTTGGLVASNTQTTMASDGTFALVAWVNVLGSASINAKFIELATGKTLFSFVGGNAIASSASPQTPRVLYANGIFTVLWMNNTGISEVHWSSSAIAAGSGAMSSITAVATAPSSPEGFDAITNGNNILLLYGAAAPPAGKTMLTKYAAGTPGVVTNVELVTSASARIPPVSASWIRDLGASGKIGWVSIGSGGGGVIAQWDVNLSTGVPATSYNLSATAYPSGVFTVTAFTYSANAAGEFIILWQTLSASFPAAQPAPLMIGGRNSGGTITAQVWINSTSLMSNPFAHNGDFYVLIAYESQTQGTDFVIRVPTLFFDTTDFTQAPSARYCSQKGNGADRVLTDVTAISSSRFLASTVVRTRFLHTQAGSTAFDLGIDLLNVQFDPATGTSREYADSTYICGGLLGAFDGQTFAEDGFHVFPEAPVVTPTAGGSMTALGSYYYLTVFKYIDANGRVHRSAPSDLAFVTLPVGDRSVSISQKTLKLTGRPGQNAIELYRVINAGDEPVSFVLVQVVKNNELNDTVTIVDDASDASLAGSLALYCVPTDGLVGVLPSGPPPTPLALSIFNGQLAAVLADDPTLIQICLPLTDFDGLGWPIFDNAQVSSIRIQDAYGDLVGLAGMDDKLLAFKGNAVYVLNGTGPDVTGNGTWGTPSRVCTGTGCSQPRTIVETSEGVIFRSTSGRSGYYLINRGLTLQYIGAPVQAYLNDTIVDAVYVADLDRVMFFTSNGRTHVFDQQLQLWTTFTNQAAASAGLYAGLPIYQQAGQSSFSALREDSSGSAWDENGTANDEYALTPWLSLAGGLKGYERFYKLQGIGQTVAPHLLTLTMWVNFDDSTPFSTTSIQIGGPGPTADWNAWEFKHPSKATSVRFGIRVGRTLGDHSDGAGANITGITIEYGTKAGLRKVPFGNRTT